jgi:hypothetical protein
LFNKKHVFGCAFFVFTDKKRPSSAKTDSRHCLPGGDIVSKMRKNTPLRTQKQQTIFFLHFLVDLKAEKPFNTPRRPDSSVGRAED